MARDLAAAGYGTLKPLDIAPHQGTFDSPVRWQLDLGGQDHLCPSITGIAFNNVMNPASPEWMARRLTAVGQRPISALVDITNYVMIDLGRPLHAYDIDKINGDTLYVRLAKQGETFAALNEKTYDLGSDMLVIGDADGADDLAGVMGGERTGVRAETTRMFLEIAIFDPISVATTGRQLNLHSDARYRFERGLDATAPQTMAGHIARLVTSICGGQASHAVEAGSGVDWQRQIDLTQDKLTRSTGIELPADRQQHILEQLGFIIETAATGWRVTPPSWRGDIDGAADLVEEIARIHGFDHLPVMALPRSQVVSQPAVNAAQLRPLQYAARSRNAG